MILDILKNCISTAKTPDEAVKNIQNMLGGSRIYIPYKDIKQRHRMVKEYFTGNNHKETCEAFDICSTTLYRILHAKNTPDDGNKS